MKIIIDDDACGRYVLQTQAKDLAKHYNLSTAPKDFQPNYNVAPGQIMPVVTGDETGRHLELMRWGIPRFIGKDVRKELINTRMESAFKPFWNRLVLNQRVLIPATGFYEWKTLPDAPKEPYLIHPKEEALYSFAGIWSRWKDDTGKDWQVYSIMTTESNKEMSEVHNRAPVMLHPEDESSWLEPSTKTRDDIEPLLRPYEDNGLEIYRVSDKVGNTRNNYKQLADPLAT